MAILVGVDEAGYGPNLGPLVISLTAWQLTEAPRQCHKQWSAGEDPPDLYRRLAAVICDHADEQRIAIADSKQLYQRENGLGPLERAVCAGLLSTGRTVRSWSELLSATRADPESRRFELPWYADYECDVPADCARSELAAAAALLSREFAASSTRLLEIRSRAVFPREFNECIRRYGSKSAALSHITLELIRDILSSLCPRRPAATAASKSGGQRQFGFDDDRQEKIVPRERAWVVCDKHGSRDRYGSLLEHHFPFNQPQPLMEGRAESRYECGDREAPLLISFCRGGERFLPTALASMTSKYVRELAMRGLNAYWQSLVPGLRPTAGYPVDARRFQGEIRAVQHRLGIDDRFLWRVR